MRVLVIIIVLLGIAEAAVACSCASAPSIADDVKSSRAVVTGRVLRIEDQFTPLRKASFWVRRSWARVTAQYHEPELTPREYGFIVTVEPLRWWKGEEAGTLELLTGRGGGDCGYVFEVGKTYLLYVNRRQVNWYDVDICSRTRPIGEATDDLRHLASQH